MKGYFSKQLDITAHLSATKKHRSADRNTTTLFSFVYGQLVSDVVMSGLTSRHSRGRKPGVLDESNKWVENPKTKKPRTGAGLFRFGMT